MLLSLVGLKITLLVLVFDPAGLIAFDLPKSLVSRATEWVMAALLVIIFTEYGHAVLPRTRIHLGVLSLAGAYVLTFAFAENRYVAMFGDQDRYLGLTFLGDMLCLYVACAAAVRHTRDVAVLVGAIGLSGAVALAYAAVQALGLDPLRWVDDYGGRPFATFGNPDQFGHFLSILFGVALGAALGASRPFVRASTAAGTLAPLVIGAFVATRGTLLGVGAALLSALVVVRPRWRVGLVAGLTVTVVAALLALTPIGTRASGTLRGVGTADRLTLYETALRAWPSRPVFGYGPDNFRAAYAEHRSEESLRVVGSGPQTSAHDWLLEAAVTTGVVGLGALIVLVALGTIELARLARARPSAGAPLFLGWVAYWAHAFVGVGSVAIGWFPWVALGVATALMRRHGYQQVAARHVPLWLSAGILLIALAGAASGARALLSNRDAFAAERLRAFGDVELAITFADRSVARDSGRADNWNRLGLALDAGHQWRGSAEAYGEAARREPHEAVYWANLARGLARVAFAGEITARDDAMTAARQAVLVDPNAPVGHLVLAEIAVAFSSCDLARVEATRAAQLQSGHDDLVLRASSCR